MELRLRCWPDGCGDTKETTGCQVGLRQASTWGHASTGHVSRRGLARRTCCCCLFLLLLVAAAAAAGGGAAARGYAHALQSTRERIASQRQRCLKRERTKKSGLRSSRGKLGQSKASGKFSANRKQLSNLISTTFGSTVICFPNMTNLAISSQICLGFVTSRRYRENR